MRHSHAKIIALYEIYRNAAEVGRQIGVSRTHVRNILIKNGIVLAPIGRQVCQTEKGRYQTDKRYLISLLAKGLCWRCAKKKIYKARHCKDCYPKRKALVRAAQARLAEKRREGGFCSRCGRIREDWHMYCVKCQEYSREQRRKKK